MEEETEVPQGEVDFSQLSDEELDSYFTEDTAGEDAPQDELQEASAFEQDTGQPESISAEEQTQEESPQQQADSPRQAPQESQEEYVRRLEQERQKLAFRLQQKEKYIQQRSHEIGELRKALKSQVEERKQGLEERYLENPAQATEDVLKINELQKEEQRLAAAQQELVRRYQSESLVHSFVPAEEFDLNTMALVLKDDGLDESYIGKFVADPYSMAAPESLIHLSKRAQMAKVLREKEQVLREVAEYTKHLFDENRRLKGQSTDVLKKVDQAARSSQEVAASAALPGPAEPELPVHMLSDDELDAYLAKAMKGNKQWQRQR